MADQDFMVIMNNRNNLSKDRYVNTIYYQTGGALDSTEAIMDGIHAAYQTHLITHMAVNINSMDIKAYAAGRNPGGPLITKRYPYAPGGSPGPAEVALCLSYFAQFNQPRRRGRLYLGPFSNDTLAERPERVMTSAASFARAIAAIGAGSVANWRQRSAITGAYADVTDFFVDNAWDTQRRRGATPTARTVGSV